MGWGGGGECPILFLWARGFFGPWCTTDRDRRSRSQPITNISIACTGKIKNVYRHQSPLFSKKAMPWGKKIWPVQMNLPFFAVKAYVPGGVQNQAEKNSKNAFRPVPVQKFTFRSPAKRSSCCLMSDRLSIAMADFGLSDHYPKGTLPY